MQRLTTTSLLLLLCVTPLAAQDLEDVCARAGELAVGQWAAYRVDGFGGVRVDTRYAIVGQEPVEGQESVEGQDQYWLELELPGGMMMQMLIPSYPFPPESVRRVVAKIGDGPAMEYPEEMAVSMGRQGQNVSEPLLKACNESETVGWETVTVPAGTFHALRVKVILAGGGERDIWLSKDVPFGIIRNTEPEGKGLVLLDHGTDATSSITETPQKFGAPGPG
jgi:hypothetical protein